MPRKSISPAERKEGIVLCIKTFIKMMVEVCGKDAAAFLDHFFTGNISSLAVGRDRYTTMLNEQGEIIDDVVIFRIQHTVAHLFHR